MKKPEPPFFVGYFKLSKKIRPFLLAFGISLALFMSAAGLVTGGTQDDPGNGAFRFDYGRQTVTGVIESLAYPLLHVTTGNDRIKKGDTFMLTAQGKSGIMGRARPLEGKQVKASGVVLERGELVMFQLRGGKKGLSAAAGEGAPPEPVPLGKWRLTGEICDGKCLAGAMRPGRGLAHKACAALCLLGDIPPVFVSTQPVEGAEFLMVVGKDGGPMPKAAYDHIAQFISVEGEITRHGDILVFRIDPETIELAS